MVMVWSAFQNKDIIYTNNNVSWCKAYKALLHLKLCEDGVKVEYISDKRLVIDQAGSVHKHVWTFEAFLFTHMENSSFHHTRDYTEMKSWRLGWGMYGQVPVNRLASGRMSQWSVVTFSRIVIHVQYVYTLFEHLTWAELWTASATEQRPPSNHKDRSADVPWHRRVI